MAAKRQLVSIKVDKNYFEKFFEPERIRISRIKGCNFSQSSFTAFIAASGARLKYPKNSLKYGPHVKRRKTGFYSVI